MHSGWIQCHCITLYGWAARLTLMWPLLLDYSRYRSANCVGTPHLSICFHGERQGHFCLSPFWHCCCLGRPQMNGRHI